MYYEYVLCYVDDVICISDEHFHTMKSIQVKFKLKGGKIDKPDVYLGAQLSKITNVGGQYCWTVYSDKYCTAEVTNVESVLEKS